MKKAQPPGYIQYALPDYDNYQWEEYREGFLGFVSWENAKDGFPVWIAEKRFYRLRSFLPDWEIFDKEGNVAEDLDMIKDAHFPFRSYTEGLFPVQWDAESDVIHFASEHLKLFRRYDETMFPSVCQNIALNAIPADIRRIAAPFITKQWVALDAMRADPGMIDFLAQEAKTDNAQYCSLCWNLCGIHNMNHYDRRRFNERLRTTGRNEMLRCLLGFPVNNSTQKLIRKYRHPLNRSEILRLQHLTTTQKARVINQFDRLSNTLVDIINHLPAWLISKALVDALHEAYMMSLNWSAVIPPLILAPPEDKKGLLYRALRQVKNLDHLEDLVHRWSLKLALRRKFIRPPLQSSDRLIAIANSDELLDEAKTMHNCLAGYANDIAEGNSFFYRWFGEERATVQLSYNRNIQKWYVREHLGINNAQLACKSIIEIYREVIRMHPDHILFLKETRIAGIQYYDAHTVASTLHKGEILKIVRDANNEYDANAIRLYNSNDVMLGYIPRSDNATLSSLMDAGLAIKGTISGLRNDSGTWIFM